MKGRKDSPEELLEIQKKFGSNGTFSSAGIGVGFRGKSFADESDREHRIELVTRWILILYMPIIPLGSYRIRRSNTFISGRGRITKTFELFSQEPLAWKQILRLWFYSALVIMVVVLLFEWLVRNL